jgi:hypothetical protein
MVLRAIGAPFELVEVDVANEEHHREPFLSLNPVSFSGRFCYLSFSRPRIPRVKDAIAIQFQILINTVANNAARSGSKRAPGKETGAELRGGDSDVNVDQGAAQIGWFHGVSLFGDQPSIALFQPEIVQGDFQLRRSMTVSREVPAPRMRKSRPAAGMRNHGDPFGPFAADSG